ncbi:hypothetical protein TURU_068055 [Turdus rufiventris]|nr:hypothetical protein TURU_068055 [Turdus rufiventris]
MSFLDTAKINTVLKRDNMQTRAQNQPKTHSKFNGGHKIFRDDTEGVNMPPGHNQGKHSFTKTRRLRRASYATVCQWIVDAWHKVSARTVIRGFTKADIISGLTSDGIKSTETNDSGDEDTGGTGLGLLDAAIAQLMIFHMEDEEFEGFMEDE